MDKNRQNRIRRLVKGLNKTRHTQAKKIDMLCNDMVPALDEFLQHLHSLQFATDFYEAVIGIGSLERMLEIASEHICSEISDISLTTILLEPEPIASHHSTTSTLDIDAYELSDCITDKLIKNICRSNRICTLEDLFKMGFSANPAVLKKISIAAIPLSKVGPAVGTMLIYRSAQNPLRPQELTRIASITTGFSKAITSSKNQTQKKNFELKI